MTQLVNDSSAENINQYEFMSGIYKLLNAGASRVFRISNAIKSGSPVVELVYT